MRKVLTALVFLALSPMLFAQQTFNNDAIVRLVKAGLSDDLIVSTINAQPGTYDTSVNGLIALKTGGVSDKVVAAIVSKNAGPAAPPSPNTAPPAPPQNAQAPPADKPRVFLQSASKGNQWNAARDQSMEMGKDFEKDCPDVRVTLNQQAADYTVVLNHIEVGLMRDNQFQVANRQGDLIARTKEGGSIDGGVKKACKIILDDYSAKSGLAPR